jgi:hypothetical protein
VPTEGDRLLGRHRRGEERVLELTDLLGGLRRDPSRFGIARLAKPLAQLRLDLHEKVAKRIPL